MSKKILFTLLVLISGCAGAVTAGLTVLVVQEYRADHDGPLELIVRNTSSGPDAMTEVRVINDIGCAAELTNMGSGYANAQDKTVLPNEPGLITESGCVGMLLKANAGAIRLDTHDVSACPASVPISGVALCTDTNGSLWATTKNGGVTLLAN